MLREARERSNLDLQSAARSLKIRPDILRAIEDEDFSRIPPRGYARNMTSAYARLVGLDPREITSLYLDAADQYESGRTADDTRTARSTDSSPQTSRTSVSRRRASERGGSAARSGSGFLSGASSRTSSSGRSRGDVDGGRGRQRTARLDDSGYAGSTRRTRSTGESARQRRSSGQGSYPGFFSTLQGSSAGGLPLRPILVVAAIIVVVIIIIVLVVLVSGRSKSAVEVPEDVPISGLTDTSDDSDSSSSETSSKDAEPKSAKVVYEVDSGSSSWIEVDIDDSDEPEVQEVVGGPYTSDSFDVTGTLLFKTANPDAVKLLVDGEEVELTADDDDEYYSYTVDFPQILAAWRSDHGIESDSDEDDESSSNSKSSSNSRSSSNSNSSNSDDDDSSIIYYDYDDSEDDDYDSDYDYDEDYDYDYDYDDEDYDDSDYDYDDEDYDYDYDSDYDDEDYY